MGEILEHKVVVAICHLPQSVTRSDISHITSNMPFTVPKPILNPKHTVKQTHYEILTWQEW